MKHLLLIISAVMLFTACSKEDDNGPSLPGPAHRTVMVYMVGENSLNPYMQRDINEMLLGRKQVAASENLVLFVDKLSKKEMPFIAKVTNEGKLDTLYRYEQDFYSSDPDNMVDVIDRIYQMCPATDDYGLVLWSHASGWLKADSIAYSRAYGVDNGTNSSYSNSGPFLNIPTIRRILEGQPHLDFFFADCCNFMCLESIYELRNVTDYIVGSPAEIPDPGAPYATVVPEMFKRQDAARGIMQKYADCYEGSLPLSVTKTSEMDALAEATSDVLKAIYSRLDTEYPDMTGLIHYYNESSRSFSPYYNIFYDAGDFVKRYATDAEYKQWKAAFDRVVIDKAFAKSWTVNKTWYTHYSDFEMTEEKFHGVSMFVPQDPNYGYYNRYNKDIKMMAWWWKVWE